MAKDRHRIFEIYESRDEAAWELMPKANQAGKDVADWEPSDFEQLVVSRMVGITHVQFKEAELINQEMISQIQEDFAELVDQLPGNSRLLIDFTGVTTFNPAGINALMALNKKLQNRGSRMVLCCLDTNVRATFFGMP